MGLALVDLAWTGTGAMTGSGEGRADTPRREIPSRPTVLVVDDDEGLRTLVRSMLRLGGYDVLSAGSAEEALDIAARHEGSVDLLLTDVVLPGLAGPELAARMTAAHPTLRVLLMTGAGAGVAATLRKPFGVSTLLAAVRSALLACD